MMRDAEFVRGIERGLRELAEGRVISLEELQAKLGDRPSKLTPVDIDSITEKSGKSVKALREITVKDDTGHPL